MPVVQSHPKLSDISALIVKKMENLKRLMQRQKSLPEGSKESKQTIHTLEDSNLQYESNRKDGNKPSLYKPSIGSHYMKL